MERFCKNPIDPHAMVHHPSFLYHFLHALYDFNADKAVGKDKSEEYAFGFQILFLVLNRFLPVSYTHLELYKRQELRHPRAGQEERAHGLHDGEVHHPR